jgi:hypothetical protein
MYSHSEDLQPLSSYIEQYVRNLQRHMMRMTKTPARSIEKRQHRTDSIPILVKQEMSISRNLGLPVRSALDSLSGKTYQN